MRNDNFEMVWQEVHGHVPSVDSFLVQSWVRDTWREVAEARTWSWLRRKLVLQIPAPYTTGTVSIPYGSELATFTNTALTQSHVGRQFRCGTSGSIYDIVAVNEGSQIAQIYPAFSDQLTTYTGLSYKIFTAYITPPDSDFFAWIAVSMPSRNRRLRLHINQEDIDFHDSARSRWNSNGPACLSGIDWTRSSAGRVYSTLIVRDQAALGYKPVSGGSYTGQTESIIIIRVTQTGTVDAGTLQFTSQKDTAAASAAQVAVVDGNYVGDDVMITFPSVVSFTSGDTYVVRVSPQSSPGVPRCEIYPHPNEAVTLNCTIATRVHDIDEAGFVLPYTMRGDVVKLGALAKLARRYPGTDEKPNPYSQVARATALENEYQDAIAALITADDYVMETNVSGTAFDQMEYALLPWMTSSGNGLFSSQQYDGGLGLLDS